MEIKIQPSSANKSDFANFIYRHRLIIAYAFIVISSLCLGSALNADIQGDVLGYQGMADDLLAGYLPYRDHVLEYPPYVIPIFLLPHFFWEDNYLHGFMALAFLADLLMKLWLFAIGIRQLNTARALMPLLLYCAGTPFIHFFFLQRYDILPALLSVLIIWLFFSRHYLASGLVVSIGIGLKLYPVLFVPPLLVLVLRQGYGKRFCAGLAFGLLPIGILSFYLPWWRFVAFQTTRGLQVESLYSSVLWFGHLVGVDDIYWTHVNKWYEVQGPLASTILLWVPWLFTVCVCGSILIAVQVAAKLQKNSAAQIARLLLIPLLSFVVLNQVFSPQYMIWLLPLAAIGSLEGNPWPLCAISFSVMLTPLFYPVADYGLGLSLMETMILLLRNFILVAVWISLVYESFKKIPPIETRGDGSQMCSIVDSTFPTANGSPPSNLKRILPGARGRSMVDFSVIRAEELDAKT